MSKDYTLIAHVSLFSFSQTQVYS